VAAIEHGIEIKPRELLPRGPDQALPIHLLARLIDWALVLAAAVMIILVFFNVCTHAAGHDLSETTEACELLMVWVSFLGGASIIRRSGHMTITEFIDKLDPARRRWADAAVQSLCLAMLLVLTRFGWSLVGGNWGNELTVLEWPMAIQYMGMAVGCTLMGVFVAFDVWQTLRGVPREQRYPHSEQ
jgi:TRAP-type C4-dicarboxylate transport system permease small subunit